MFIRLKSESCQSCRLLSDLGNLHAEQSEDEDEEEEEEEEGEDGAHRVEEGDHQVAQARPVLCHLQTNQVDPPHICKSLTLKILNSLSARRTERPNWPASGLVTDKNCQFDLFLLLCSFFLFSSFIGHL